MFPTSLRSVLHNALAARSLTCISQHVTNVSWMFCGCSGISNNVNRICMYYMRLFESKCSMVVVYYLLIVMLRRCFTGRFTTAEQMFCRCFVGLFVLCEDV